MSPIASPIVYLDGDHIFPTTISVMVANHHVLAATCDESYCHEFRLLCGRESSILLLLQTHTCERDVERHPDTPVTSILH